MDNKIKIVYMIDTLGTDLAGTENQLIKLINGLDKNRFELYLVCFNKHPWLEANEKNLACVSRIFEVNRFKSPYTYINFSRLVGFLRSIKPDIVQTFFPTANIVGVTAARAAGVKVILSSRRDYGEWMSRRYLSATKFANRFVDRIIANSRQVKELTVEKEGVDAGRVDVIYNGIDVARFNGMERDEGVKKSLNIPAGNKVVGIIANFRPMKHHATLIKAAAGVLKERSDVDFVLIGTGPLKEQTERLAAELGISERVHFTGAQKKVLPYLSIMDVGVNCSEGEGLSNAVMEYMAVGIPCVVSEAGGNPDLITDGVEGCTFAVYDHRALCDCILKVIGDKATADKFVKNALAKIENHMSLGTMLSTHEAYYEKLANG